MLDVSVHDGSVSSPVTDNLDNPHDNKITQTLYQLSPAMIFRDERLFFNSEVYLAANPSRLSSWCFGSDIHWLLEFLLKPRSLAEIAQMQVQISDSTEDPAKILELLQSMQQIGIVTVDNPDSSQKPCICHPRFSSKSRYMPASAPVSIMINLPIKATLLSKILCECDKMGVMGIDFNGGEDALHSLSTSITEESIKAIRAASSIRLRLKEVSQETFIDLRNIMQLWNRLPFIIIECDQIPDQLHDTQLQRFPFCITYQVQESDDEQTLNHVVDASLSGGARFVLFDINDNHIGTGSQSVLESVTEKLEIVQSIQKSNTPLKVQIRVHGLPLLQDVLTPELTARQVLGQMLGGCSVGLLLGNTQGKSCDHITSPDELIAIGPILPPNCCQAGMTYMAIDENGIVYPCEKAIGNPDMVIGSIADTSLSDIWDSEKWAFFRGGWDLFDLEGCYECKSYIACSTRRCRAHAAQTSGDLLSPMSACLKSKDALGIYAKSGKEVK